MSDALGLYELQHAKLRCPSPSPRVAQIHVHWVSDAIQPSHPLLLPSSFCLQSFPASGAFPMSQLFALGGQSTGASASVSDAMILTNSMDSGFEQTLGDSEGQWSLVCCSLWSQRVGHDSDWTTKCISWIQESCNSDFSLSQFMLIFYETEETLNCGQPYSLCNATDREEESQATGHSRVRANPSPTLVNRSKMYTDKKSMLSHWGWTFTFPKQSVIA